LVLILARAAGFLPSEALTIAASAQHVDEFAFSQPFTPFTDPLRAFHFASPSGGRDPVVPHPSNPVTQQLVQKLSSDWTKLRGVNRLAKLGIVSHVVADTYSHQGVNAYWAALQGGRDMNRGPRESVRPNIGHAELGAWPDMPFLRPQTATDAAGALYEIFRDAASADGRAPLKSWQELQSQILREFKRVASRDPAVRVFDWSVSSLSAQLGLSATYSPNRLQMAPVCELMVLQDFDSARWGRTGPQAGWYGAWLQEVRSVAGEVLALEGSDPFKSDYFQVMSAAPWTLP